MRRCTLKPESKAKSSVAVLMAAALLTSGVALFTPALAQVPIQVRPDAGQVLRERDQSDPSRQRPSKETPPILIPQEHPVAPSPDGTRIPVKALHITGATVFTEDELSALLNPWKGRELALEDLQTATERITHYYREHGYLVARAYLPEQTIRDGIVEIAVLEGRIGQVILKNSSGMSENQAQAWAGNITPGTVIHEPELERTLILLNDTPGISTANAALQPGASVGLSDLVVSLQPAPFVSGEIDASNYGNRYTGAYLLGGTLNLNSPLHIGDQITARIQASDEKLYYGRLAYRAPIGTSGLAAGGAWSASRYRLGQNFAVLNANGDAHIGSIFATFPFVRSRTSNVMGVLTYDQKSLEDRIDSTATAVRKKVKLVTAGLTSDGRWNRLGYNLSLGYTAGHLDIETPDAAAIDASTARSNGHYAKLSYAASGLLPIAGAWSVFAAVSGQRADKNLDSSEKFSLGGAEGVRAYPQGEAAADEGYLATTELRYMLASAFISGFIDTGTVRINHAPFADSDNHRHLSAVGLGFNWKSLRDFQVKASVAWKLGNASATSDTDRHARAWLQAVKYF
jgi:hemolysin activation/secretion protein